MGINVEALRKTKDSLRPLSLQTRLKIFTYEIAAKHPLLAMCLARYQGIDRVYQTPQKYQEHFGNTGRTIKRTFEQLQERRLRRTLGGGIS